MIGMGIDASTTCCGYAIFSDDDLIDYGQIKPSNDKAEWRDRVQDFAPKIQELINKYKVEKIVQEDVPLIKRQMITLVQLGCMQGLMLGIATSNNIPIQFISVSTWRKNRGILKGQLDRNAMKVKSIELANKTFNINLPCVFTKSGNYNSKKSADDCADAINVYASTLDKYKVTENKFGRR